MASRGRSRFSNPGNSSPGNEEFIRRVGRGRSQYSSNSHSPSPNSFRGRGPCSTRFPAPSKSDATRGESSAHNTPSQAGQMMSTPDPAIIDSRLMPVCTIDEATKSWLNQLKFVWGLWKKSPGVTNLLHQYYASAPNPYRAALFVMDQSGDGHQAKTTSLAFTVMDEFSMWIVPNQERFKHCLTVDVKHEAFNMIVTQRNTYLIKMIVSAYELTSDNLIFLEPIRCMLERKQYREACQSASHLNLHDHFEVEDLLIPLVFQDKINVAEEFLKGSVTHRQELVKYLDILLGKRSIKAEADTIICQLNIPEVRRDKLYPKTLSKLVARLVKSYNLPPDFCPNLIKKRREGALQFLIHKRYVDNTLGTESFREMVMETLSNEPDMAEELVASCNNAGDIQESFYWAQKLSVPEHLWPYNVTEFATSRASAGLKSVTDSRNTGCEDSTENWDECVKDNEAELYHRFPLLLSDIIIVNDEVTFQQLLDVVQRVPMVGLDSEWKPHFGTKSSELALIQIATGNHVFILDVIALDASFAHQWQNLAAVLFNNRDILKLGFSLGSDLTKMKSSLPELQNIGQKGCGFLDFASLWRRLIKENDFVFPHKGNDTNTGESLSRLVELTLGKRLDKSEQFSNWERRPLRDSQKIYAALDAHCLLQVYQILEVCCCQQEIPFTEMCEEITNNRLVKGAKSNKSKSSRSYFQAPSTTCDPSPHMEPKSARSVRMVCDTMVQGLGKKLRMCGVNTEILENGQSSEHCARIAQREQRFILTRGKNHQVLMSYVPSGWCYPVVSETLDEQLEEVINYFNVTVTKEDVFSRCQCCNSNELELVSNETMVQLSVTATVPVASPTQQFARLHQNCVAEQSEPSSLMADSWFSDEDDSDEEGHAAPVNRVLPTRMLPINVERCETKYGARVQITAIPKEIMQKVDMFYVCLHCGKCYWDGSHYERYLDSIQRILKV